MTMDRNEWLGLIVEPPLDSNLAICDAHHHLWDRPTSRYMPDGLMRDIGGVRVTSTVFVECSSGYRREGPVEMRPVGETEFVKDIAVRAASGQYGNTRIAAGIVGFADLTLGIAVEPVLEAHMQAGRGYFKGIRHSSCWDASPEIPSYMNQPPGLLLQPGFREGFACLGKRGLSFDAWLYFHQMSELADLARAFPDTTIVLDHIGGNIGVAPYADRRAEMYDRWLAGIVELATCPNVVVKVGGLGMTRTGFGWHERPVPPDSVELAEAMKPYYLRCIEHFGVERCMFESNFPVDRASYSYIVMWNAYIRLTQGFSAAEKQVLFHDTALRVYRIHEE